MSWSTIIAAAVSSNIGAYRSLHRSRNPNGERLPVGGLNGFSHLRHSSDRANDCCVFPMYQGSRALGSHVFYDLSRGRAPEAKRILIAPNRCPSARATPCLGRQASRRRLAVFLPPDLPLPRSRLVDPPPAALRSPVFANPSGGSPKLLEQLPQWGMISPALAILSNAFACAEKL